MKTPDEIQRWASGFVEACGDLDSEDDQLSPYIGGLMPTGNVEPEDRWRIILAILAMKPSDSVVSILAAGPLEDLIHSNGEMFIGRIEEEARRNPAFRNLLGGVWGSGSSDVWVRVEKARGGIVW